jgi:hypothetical protein
MRNDAGLSAEALPLDMEWHIDAVCCSFEAAGMAVGRGGPRPRIEEYLTDAAEAERWPLLRELIRVELARQAGAAIL